MTKNVTYPELRSIPVALRSPQVALIEVKVMQCYTQNYPPILFQRILVRPGRRAPGEHLTLVGERRTVLGRTYGYTRSRRYKSHSPRQPRAMNPSE